MSRLPDFSLHPRLEADTVLIGDLPLCRVLLMNDTHYPWCILVPRRDAIREIHELETPDRRRLIDESCALGQAMMTAFDGHKLNIAALGNVVPQLHLHHVVRYTTDAAWPAPVWGRHPPLPCSGAQLQSRISGITGHLQGLVPAHGEN